MVTVQLKKKMSENNESCQNQDFQNALDQFAGAPAGLVGKLRHDYSYLKPPAAESFKFNGEKVPRWKLALDSLNFPPKRFCRFSLDVCRQLS